MVVTDDEIAQVLARLAAVPGRLAAALADHDEEHCRQLEGSF